MQAMIILIITLVDLDVKFSLDSKNAPTQFFTRLMFSMDWTSSIIREQRMMLALTVALLAPIHPVFEYKKLLCCVMKEQADRIAKW